jgi:hypothetical protein
VAEAAAALQERAPQVPTFKLYDGGDEMSWWADGESAGWVRVAAVVEAGDRVWGRYDRSEASRGPQWTPRAAAGLLAQPDSELPAFWRRHLLKAPVNLTLVNGLAGPVYGLCNNGAHRTHLFKILDLPWLFAKQYACILPRTLNVALVIDTRKGIPEARRTTALWQGLLDHGLAHGRIATDSGDATFHLDHAPAPWMLGNREFACAYNTAYQRAYPGALAGLGVPDGALTGPDAWEAWLTGTR